MSDFMVRVWVIHKSSDSVGLLLLITGLLGVVWDAFVEQFEEVRMHESSINEVKQNNQSYKWDPETCYKSDPYILMNIIPR